MKLSGRSQGTTAQRPLTEAQCLRQVLAVAELGGWRCYHAWLSVRSSPGFPDLCCAKAGEPLVLAELKTAVGKVTPFQQRWLALLRQVQGVEVYVWRPSDIDVIQERLLCRPGTRLV